MSNTRLRRKSVSECNLPLKSGNEKSGASRLSIASFRSLAASPSDQTSPSLLTAAGLPINCQTSDRLTLPSAMSPSDLLAGTGTQTSSLHKPSALSAPSGGSRHLILADPERRTRRALQHCHIVFVKNSNHRHGFLHPFTSLTLVAQPSRVHCSHLPGLCPVPDKKSAVQKG